VGVIRIVDIGYSNGSVWEYVLPDTMRNRRKISNLLIDNNINELRLFCEKKSISVNEIDYCIK
jgi:hypothetical protein